MKNNFNKAVLTDSANPLSRYLQCRANFRAMRRDIIKLEIKKLLFHSKGLLRAISGV